ncbi:MAG: hypothetical protein K0Q92_1981 [Steroidobacteraceae bacterium]|nr:hypothetical protein [Steroidobacteraceae bacterium]
MVIEGNHSVHFRPRKIQRLRDQRYGFGGYVSQAILDDVQDFE